MNVKLTASLGSFAENRIIDLERDADLPLAPYRGLLLNGLHPDLNGYSLEVKSVCCDCAKCTVFADVGSVVVDDDKNLDAEVEGWKAVGWVVVKEESLDDDQGGDGHDGETSGWTADYAEQGADPAPVSDGGHINITDSSVYIFNGGHADVATPEGD